MTKIGTIGMIDVPLMYLIKSQNLFFKLFISLKGVGTGYTINHRGSCLVRKSSNLSNWQGTCQGCVTEINREDTINRQL